MITVFRIFISAYFISRIYLETGLFTTIFASLITIYIELDTFSKKVKRQKYPLDSAGFKQESKFRKKLNEAIEKAEKEKNG